VGDRSGNLVWDPDPDSSSCPFCPGQVSRRVEAQKSKLVEQVVASRLYPFHVGRVGRDPDAKMFKSISDYIGIIGSLNQAMELAIQRGERSAKAHPVYRRIVDSPDQGRDRFRPQARNR